MYKYTTYSFCGILNMVGISHIYNNKLTRGARQRLLQ